MIKQTELQGKLEAGDLKIIQIGKLEFLATKQGVGYLEGCKEATIRIAFDKAEHEKNFTKAGKPRKNIPSWKEYKATLDERFKKFRATFE
jgi:hypothetical protein